MPYDITRPQGGFHDDSRDTSALIIKLYDSENDSFWGFKTDDYDSLAIYLNATDAREAAKCWAYNNHVGRIEII